MTNPPVLVCKVVRACLHVYTRYSHQLVYNGGWARLWCVWWPHYHSVGMSKFVKLKPFLALKAVWWDFPDIRRQIIGKNTFLI